MSILRASILTDRPYERDVQGKARRSFSIPIRFISAMLSNLTFSFRAVYSKKVRAIDHVECAFTHSSKYPFLQLEIVSAVDKSVCVCVRC